VLSRVFICATFGGAFLLFTVEPMVGKMLLPTLGGSPTVWNVCLVFFQASLLLGYAWADYAGCIRSAPRAIAAQIALGLLVCVGLPVTLPQFWLQQPWREDWPIAWLLGALTLSVGGPFVFLSSLGPLLQKWLARTHAPGSRDPYFLYAASNLGSFGALLAYPLWVDPWIGLTVQRLVWASGFGLVVCLVAACAGCLQHSAHPDSDMDLAGSTPSRIVSSPGRDSSGPWLWLVCSLIPSALLMGTTAYLTADIASLPLLWVAPLGLYLLSFALAFSRLGARATAFGQSSLPYGALALLYLILVRATEPIWLLLLVHLAVLFIASLTCHGILSAARPAVAQLTRYYLWISLGGFAGGAICTFLAPVVFPTVLEYPLALCAACMLRDTVLRPAVSVPTLRAALTRRFIGLGALTTGCAFLGVRLPPSQLALQGVIVPGLPLVVAFLTLSRNQGAGCLVVVALVSCLGPGHANVVHRERNAFGLSTVLQDVPAGEMRLVHGNTIHGRQFLAPDRRCEPLSYYHRAGPLGDLFPAADPGTRHRVGVVGLGAGAMAAYAREPEIWTFFEIDPGVIRIASDSRWFSYLDSCCAGRTIVKRGDARLLMSREDPDSYDLLVLDAFSSDSIPTHLLSIEAIELYLSRLRPDGILTFHVSNRYMDLEPALGELAFAAGLSALVSISDIQEGHRPLGLDPATWVVMARRSAHLGPLSHSPYWRRLARRRNGVVWSDDFSDPVRLMRWY